MPNYYQRAIDCLEGIDEIIDRNQQKFDLADRAALIRFTSWLRTCLSATIPELEAENKRLKEREQLLNALEAAGVDNWDGYDEAKQTLKDT